MEINLSKSLLIVLFGEPRGIGNSADCPGTNQFDVILSDPDLMNTVDRIHVLWSITTERISFQKWENTFMVDRNGTRWEAHDYLPQDQILQNIDKFMQPYTDRVTYEVHIRQPSTLRWGREYHNVIVKALKDDYDFVMFHRPDSNISTKDNKDKTFYKEFLVTDIPGVCVTPNPSETLWKFYNEGIADKPWQGFYVSWNAYEIMLWNKKGLDLLEQYIRLKAKYEHEYVNFVYDPKFPDETEGVFQSWYSEQRIDQAEDFWSVTLLAINTFAHKFIVIDQLPFRSLIRMKGD